MRRERNEIARGAREKNELKARRLHLGRMARVTVGARGSAMCSAGEHTGTMRNAKSGALHSALRALAVAVCACGLESGWAA